MKIAYRVVLSLFLFVPFTANAYEYPMFGTDQQTCFSSAMIGMDSVINARLQVPAEHALELSLVSVSTESGESVYDNQVLNIILNAYLWMETPHSYAVKVFYDCAVENAYPRQASIN